MVGFFFVLYFLLPRTFVTEYDLSVEMNICYLMVDIQQVLSSKASSVEGWNQHAESPVW